MRLIVLVLLFVTSFSVAQTSYQEAQSLFIDNQFEKAEPLFKEHLSTNPNDLKTIEYLGDIAGHLKKWDKAIGYYKSLVEFEPENANYHYKYGGVMGMQALEVNKFKALGMIGDIKKAFKTAAELDPNHIDVRWALVEFYIQLPGIIGGSVKTAIAYADELENISKVDGYLAKGYIYEYDNEPELAEKFYKMALNVGGSMTCFSKLSNFYETHNQPDKAVKTLENAYENHHRNALHYQIGKVCANYNIQLDKGEKCLTVFIENHSVKDGIPIEWAYYRLAQIHKNKQSKSEALLWIDKALAVSSNFKQAKKEKEEILNL